MNKHLFNAAIVAQTVALGAALIVTAPVVIAADKITKLSDKAVDRFENGPKPKK
jgi:hypothetical protein